MSKSRNHKQKNQRSRNPLLMGVALVIVAIGLFALTASSNTVSTGEAITPSDYLSQFAETNTSHVLLDVRTPEEFASGHIQGAINIPVQSLQSRLSEVPSDTPIVVYCRSGNRSALASQILQEANYSSIYDMGGINTWVSQGLPIE